MSVPQSACDAAVVDTPYTQVAVARTNDEAARAARAMLAQLYWRTTYVVFRGKGSGHDEAVELAQDFAADKLLTGAVVNGYRREHGLFRSWLFACLGNFWTTYQRVGNRRRRHVAIGLDGLKSACETYDGRAGTSAEDLAILEYERASAVEAYRRVRERWSRAKSLEIKIRTYELWKLGVGQTPTPADREDLAARLGLANSQLVSRYVDEVKAAIAAEFDLLESGVGWRG